MLGRFLEITLHAPEIQASLEFYESLGFVQTPVGETWPHPYAVVTDGRLYLGLHGSVVRSPSLTFVLPQLARGVAHLKAQGVSFDQERLGDDVFNQAVFCDPSGQSVTLLEARTFSPPALDGAVATSCGYFSEFAVPTRDAESAVKFWEPLGFVAMDAQAQPFTRTTLASDHLNVALYRTRAFRQPLLTFEDQDMSRRIAELRARGFRLSDEMPDTLHENSNAILIAPEGTRLLLMQSSD